MACVFTERRRATLTWDIICYRTNSLGVGPQAWRYGYPPPAHFPASVEGLG